MRSDADFYNRKTKEFEIDSTDQKRDLDKAFCLVCEKGVELLEFPQAVSFFRGNSQKVRQFIQDSQIHLLHNLMGLVMLCADSVREVFQNMPTQPLDPNIFVTNPSHGNLDIHLTQ